jgi:8-oxo-dGTP pyrophosphatase MutT (NUDIX family)
MIGEGGTRRGFPLSPAPSVGAIIVTPDRRYLLQLRDDVPEIWFPGHWGLFGGAIDAGESPEQALRRELIEEIGVAPRKVAYFTEFHFNFGFAGGVMTPRLFYEVRVTPDEIADMRLGEGSDMRLFAEGELPRGLSLVGYDYFGLYLYMHRHRITAASDDVDHRQP